MSNLRTGGREGRYKEEGEAGHGGQIQRQWPHSMTLKEGLWLEQKGSRRHRAGGKAGWWITDALRSVDLLPKVSR